MGHSFHAGQEPFPRATQPLYLSVPETRRRRVPRSPISDPTEGIVTIGAFLGNLPPYQPHPPQQKWMSGLPFSGSQGRKRSLDLFHRSSISLKHLLRPRSEPPAPAPTKIIASRRSRDYAYSTEITGDVEPPGDSNKSSSKNQGRRNKQPRMRKQRDEETPDTTRKQSFDVAPSAAVFSNLQVSQHNNPEGDSFGIAKEYPHLVSSSSTAPRSREEKKYLVATGEGVSKLSNLNPRQCLGSNVYGSPSSPKTQKTHSNTESRKDDGHSRNQQKPTLATSSNNYPHLSTDNQANPQNWTQIQPVFPKLAPGNRSECRKRPLHLPLSMQHDEVPQQTENLRLQSPVVFNERKRSQESNPASSVCGHSPERTTSTKEPTVPSPAPTTPLPPLPDRHASLRSLFQRSIPTNHKPKEVLTEPKKLPGTPLASPPGTVVQGDRMTQTQPPKPATSKLTVHYKRQGMYDVPSTLKPERKIICEDPFEQRRLRTEKTQALKRRHVQELRIQHEKEKFEKETQGAEADCGEESDDTIILPSVDDIKPFQAATHVSPDKPTNHNNVESWIVTAGSEPAEEAFQRTSMETRHRIEDQDPDPQTTNHLEYRNQGTQYSPLIQPPLNPHQSPFLFPIPPTPPKPKSASSPQIPRCSVCAKPVHSSRNSTHTENHNSIPMPTRMQTPPKRLSWPLDELDSRLETRLAVFERRTILLEAALLAVINAFANFEMGGKEGKGSEGVRNARRRWSEKSEISAALEGKLEDMIAGINGFGRG